MEVLLDTCTLLWAINDQDKIPENIKEIINDYDNDIFVSTASLWEIEIKHLKNSELMPYDSVSVFNAIIESDFKLINVRDEYVMELGNIVKQRIHNDPFDHLLLAMAKEEKMTLITHDEFISQYKGIDIINF